MTTNILKGQSVSFKLTLLSNRFVLNNVKTKERNRRFPFNSEYNTRDLIIICPTFLATKHSDFMFQMIKGLLVLLVITVIQLSCGSVSDTDYQLKHPSE